MRSSPKENESLPRPAAAGKGAAMDAKKHDVQNIWFATLQHRWSSLAIISADGDGSAQRLAAALAEVGSAFRNAPIRVVSSTGLSLDEIAQLIEDIQHTVTADQRINAVLPQHTIIAVDNVAAEPIDMAIALACDAALLCVKIDSTRADAARKAVDMIGTDKFIGAVVLR